MKVGVEMAANGLGKDEGLRYTLMWGYDFHQAAVDSMRGDSSLPWHPAAGHSTSQSPCTGYMCTWI